MDWPRYSAHSNHYPNRLHSAHSSTWPLTVISLPSSTKSRGKVIGEHSMRSFRNQSSLRYERSTPDYPTVQLRVSGNITLSTFCLNCVNGESRHRVVLRFSCVSKTKALTEWYNESSPLKVSLMFINFWGYPTRQKLSGRCSQILTSV